MLQMGKASTSTLQRHLRLGYGRAARILDMMQRDGIIGPPGWQQAEGCLEAAGLATGSGARSDKLEAVPVWSIDHLSTLSFVVRPGNAGGLAAGSFMLGSIKPRR